MSDGNDLTQIRSITLSDTHDFMDIDSAAGSYSRQVENGVVINITIDNGKVSKYSAQDRDGKSLSMFHLQLTPADPEDINARVCYICYEVAGYYAGQICYKIGCSQM